MGAISSAPAFPAYVAYEDSIIAIGFAFQRDLSAANTHTITAHFRNKTGSNLSGVTMQAAAQKYMNLKVKAQSGPNLAPNAQDLT